MNLQPGWYPDYTQPGTERWHNGSDWTNMVRPAPLQDQAYQPPMVPPYAASSQTASGGYPQPSWPTPQPAGSHASRRFLYVLVGVLAVVGALSIWGWLSPNGLLSGTSLAGYDCEDLAGEAVALSEGEFVELLDVREPHIIEDHRQDYELPTGVDETLVLKCQGTGVWSDGSNSPVELKLTVDADGGAWIFYQETTGSGPS